MNILIVTEKYRPELNQRDGGAQLINTLHQAFADNVSIMNFGDNECDSSTWTYSYPDASENRFIRRIKNANFIIKKIKDVEASFTHILFIHLSMQFGITSYPLNKNIQVWTFPMFLSASYAMSGETVPDAYTMLERQSLKHSNRILTPSYLEKGQLINLYSISEKDIDVIPRGVKTNYLTPAERAIKGAPVFCSIGSIKPQKNILGLIQWFKNILHEYPLSTLIIIGPVQDAQYYELVLSQIQRSNIQNRVEFTGYLSQTKLSQATSSAHFHLSASSCETFGRAMFETLALGIPNIALLKNNAAADYLSGLPYIQFIKNENLLIPTLNLMMKDYANLSSKALEIGDLYNDSLLSQLLIAKITNKKSLIVSDFDGTLLHKLDRTKTNECISTFNSFPVRVICSARPLNDLLTQINLLSLKPDWIISYGGAVTSTGNGSILWTVPLESKATNVFGEDSQAPIRLELNGELLQLSVHSDSLPAHHGYRVELYQDKAYISSWNASKLHSVLRLLRHINWSGQVQAFGDGPYDLELLKYFDGVIIGNNNSNCTSICLRRSQSLIKFQTNNKEIFYAENIL